MGAQNKQMKILYITYVDFDKGNSGSSVRPVRMYNAFIGLGLDVKLLSGEVSYTNIEKRRKRKNEIKKINEWLKENKPDICYIENSTSPIKLRGDRNLIKKIHRMDIPIGYFFRDAYYKFPSDFQLNKGMKKKLIFFVQKRMYLRDERLIKKLVDIVYLPSEAVNHHLGFSETSALPPASTGELSYIDNVYKGKNTSIYVGGITGLYNVGFLIKAFEMLNKKSEKEYKLILCCRRQEYLSSNIKDLDYEWLEIHHVFGEELNELYRRSDVALIIHDPDYEYNSYAIPVKLFEYLNHGIPIVSTDCNEIGRCIKENAVGAVSEMLPQSYAESVEEVLDKSINQELRKNIDIAIKNGNRWKDRAEKVVNELSKLIKKVEMER